MRIIPISIITEAVRRLCLEAAFELPADVRTALSSASAAEESPLGRSIIISCLENADIASNKKIAICQDTGFAVFFVEIGTDIYIEGGTIQEAIDAGTAAGYEEGFLRASIVDDPLYDRKNTKNNTPAVVHISQKPGDRLKITLAPKGGGSENMSATAMLKPSDGESGVVDFVLKTVVSAGGNPCPPVIVGVGIGGTFEKCAILAKSALLRSVGRPNPDPRYADLESRLLELINASGIGPQGLGGTQTALAVHIETHPCHIASMPVAVNINCHAARHASVEF